MTLQDLIDELQALPASARTAAVYVRNGDIDDLDILSARYEGGQVIVECDQDEPEKSIGDANDFGDDV
jgi:hypothetical protein